MVVLAQRGERGADSGPATVSIPWSPRHLDLRCCLGYASRQQAAAREQAAAACSCYEHGPVESLGWNFQRTLTHDIKNWNYLAPRTASLATAI